MLHTNKTEVAGNFPPPSIIKKPHSRVLLNNLQSVWVLPCSTSFEIIPTVISLKVGDLISVSVGILAFFCFDINITIYSLVIISLIISLLCWTNA